MNMPVTVAVLDSSDVQQLRVMLQGRQRKGRLNGWPGVSEDGADEQRQ